MDYHHSALSHKALIEIFYQSSEPVAIYISSELEIGMVNKPMLLLWGEEETVIGKTLDQAIPQMKGQSFASLLNQAWQSGESYRSPGLQFTMELGGKLRTSYFDFIYQPIKDENGMVYCILHTALDVTRRVAAEQLLKEKEEKAQLINRALLSTNSAMQQTHNRLIYYQHRMQELTRTAPIGLTILQGRDLIIETANPFMLDIWGVAKKNIIGAPLMEVFPVLKSQDFSRQLDRVFTLAKIMSLKEVSDSSSNWTGSEIRYFDIDFHPLLDLDGKVSSIMATFLDVTRHIKSRLKPEESELDLQEYNKNLGVLNQEPDTDNKQLTVVNEEYTSVNE